MTCAEALRVQAYFDGELDLAEAASIDRHLSRCAACRALLAELGETRAALRNVPAVRAPAALRARILDSLDAEEATSANTGTADFAAANSAQPKPLRGSALRSRPFWFGAFAGLGVSALAAALFAFVMLPMSVGPMVEGLMSAHLQSLRPDRLVQRGLERTPHRETMVRRPCRRVADGRGFRRAGFHAVRRPRGFRCSANARR